MTLNGTLDIFPLEEIMRLLARTQQAGCLRVAGPADGRIYVDNGSLVFASVGSDDAIQADLIASGMATEDSLARIHQIGGTLNDALTPGAASTALTDLVREHTVESLYRVRRPAAGSFSFEAGRQPQYRTGQTFDLETIISQADRRAAEWADIETVVTDQTVPWRMVPTIDEESVNLSDSAWRFLAAMDGSCSVKDLAVQLGETAFQTARRMAELSRARLVEEIPVGAFSAAPASEAVAPASYQDTAIYEEPTAPEPQYEVATQQPVWEQPEAPTEPSWWGQTAEETDEASEVAQSDPVSEGQDSFLESVFSELDGADDEEAVEAEAEAEDTEESKDDSDDDSDGGFGLLRRRGLGAAFRELADS